MAVGRCVIGEAEPETSDEACGSCHCKLHWLRTKGDRTRGEAVASGEVRSRRVAELHDFETQGTDGALAAPGAAAEGEGPGPGERFHNHRRTRQASRSKEHTTGRTSSTWGVRPIWVKIRRRRAERPVKVPGTSLRTTHWVAALWLA